MTIYILDVHFLSFEPVHRSMSGFNCCFLTCTQVSQESSKVARYSHLFKNFPQFVLIHTVKGFQGVFLEFSCFFYDAMNVGNLISGSAAFSKFSLYIWKCSVHILLKPSLNDFEHYLASIWASLVVQLVKNLPVMWETWVWSLGWEDPLEKGMATYSSVVAWRIPWAIQSMGSQRVRHNWATFIFIFTLSSMWNELNCTVVWTFFGIAFLWDWNENWHFPALWPLPSFPDLLTYRVQQLNSIIFYFY